MRALHHKLIRDLMHMKGQSLAICLVMACGVATFVMSLTALRSLEQTQDRYYQQYRFADLFAQVKRAPMSLADEFAAISGVAAVQPRIVSDVTLDVADLPEPAVGRIISWPEHGRPILNDVHLRKGRLIEPGRTGEVMVSEAFANAHGLGPGDSLRAILNQRLQELRIVGIVLSPEYVLSIQGGESLPDDRHFGVLWMGYEDLANAFDMDEAFNDVSVRLLPGTDWSAVMRQIDQLTDRYGGIGAYDREDQISHRFLSDEIRSLRGMGMIVPMIFLAVAAFLLNVVMSRLISTQREQIAALKAFGYSNLEIGRHYMEFVLVIAAIGSVFGIAAGLWLAWGLTGLYARFYRFPQYEFEITPEILAAGLSVAVGAAVLGTLGAAARAVRLPPAEAMRPEPPASYRPTIVERMGLQQLVSQPARMVLRHLERRPFKAAISVLGISVAVAVMVLGSFLSDSINYMIEFGFYTQQRQDVTIRFVEPASSAAFHEIERLPGVLHAEPLRSIPVRLRSGSRWRRGGIMGLSPDARLLRVIDETELAVPLPPEGLVVNDKLAEILDVRPGDEVELEVLEGRREHYHVRIAAIVREYVGTNAYMNIHALHRLLQEQDTLSGAFLSVDASKIAELYAQLKRTPRVAGVSIKEATVESFNQTQAENQRQIQFFNVIFACIIAAGVVYNTARISLSERGRELATLRVIGFTRGEISAILLGELAVLTLLALPLGMALGYGFAALTAAAVDSESFRVPVVVTLRSYGFASLVVILSAIGSGLLVRRRLDHLDLVAVLKSRE